MGEKLGECSGAPLRRARHRGAWQQGSNGGARTAAWRPRWRSVEQVAGAGVGEVDAGLGQIWADLDLGPKTKFVHHVMLYISHLSCQVIRALDQWIISVLIASVNGLTAITKLQKSMVKTRSNECHLYTCSSPSCTLQLLYLDQIELLNKLWRT